MITQVVNDQWLNLHRELFSTGLTRFEYLTAVHISAEEFEVFSKLSSPDLAEKILLKTQTQKSIQSVCEIYSSARFYEQETHQMFGLEFTGHKNIQRAFAVDFEGYPMRKDFSLPNRINTPWPGATPLAENSKRQPALPPGVFKEWIQ